MKNIDQMSHTLYYQLADLYEVHAIYHHGDNLLFRVRSYGDPVQAETQMKKRLGDAGFDASVNDDGTGSMITVKAREKKKFPWLNILLFILTVATMYYVYPGSFGMKMEFVISLSAILLFHEFGHYFAGKHRGVIMSLPYFIPAPNIVGTFGAIIKSKTPFTNRRDLIEVGAAGPVSGFIIALIVLIYGLQNATLVNAGNAGLMLGDSLLIRLLSWLIVGPIPEGKDFVLSPAAWAGWVGLLVTMLNLLPIGQLDGGHIIYGLAGRFQHKVAQFFLVVLAIMGFWWFGWWFFGLLVFIFGLKHPPTMNDRAELPMHAKILGYAAIVIFILSFIPEPFKLG